MAEGLCRCNGSAENKILHTPTMILGEKLHFQNVTTKTGFMKCATFQIFCERVSS